MESGKEMFGFVVVSGETCVGLLVVMVMVVVAESLGDWTRAFTVLPQELKKISPIRIVK